MTRSADLSEYDHAHLDDLMASCPHLTASVEHVHGFAGLLTERHSTEVPAWMRAAEDSDLRRSTRSSTAA